MFNAFCAYWSVFQHLGDKDTLLYYLSEAFILLFTFTSNLCCSLQIFTWISIPLCLHSYHSGLNHPDFLPRFLACLHSHFPLLNLWPVCFQDYLYKMQIMLLPFIGFPFLSEWSRKSLMRLRNPELFGHCLFLHSSFRVLSFFGHWFLLAWGPHIMFPLREDSYFFCQLLLIFSILF